MSHNRKKYIKFLIILILLLASIGIIFAAVRSTRSQTSVTRREGASQVDTSDWEDTILYHGKTYRRRQDVKTILFLGVDDTQQVHQNGVVGNRGRTDTLMLFLVERTTHQIRLLQIPRDSMVDVDVYDDSGEYVFTGNMQINMQYAFGCDDKNSCDLTAEKVSNLLYGTPIDYCMALKLDGIANLVETIGGIHVILPEDYTEIDPSYVKGAEITFNGASAERFVRYRDISKSGSNNNRINRQSWLITELFRQLRQDSGKLNKLMAFIQGNHKDYYSDIDSDILDRLVEYTFVEEVNVVPGEIKQGVSTEEYYVDDDALRDQMMELFYEIVE